MALEALPAALSPDTARRSMAAVLSAMTTLAAAARDAGCWPVDVRRGLLEDMDRAVDGLAAVRATILVAERESGTWREGGDRSFAAWRSRVARTTPRSAQAQVREAEHLQTVPTAVEAVTAGRITMDHASAIARVAGTGTPAQREAVLDGTTQEELVELAERTNAGTFATAVASWAATVDPAGLERDHQAQRRERCLHLSETPDGTFIKGRLDSMAGHRVALALEALTSRPAADDDRDLGQRRADALDTMAGRVLADADVKPGAHVPPHVSLIVAAETWEAARAERDRRRQAAAQGSATGTGLLSPGEVGAAPPATLEDGTPVPVSELALTMCDCAVTRIAIDAEGAPLDLGRTARVFTGPQRRAVIARDRECIWLECHMPARWCQIHHTRWWERDGGSTSVDEGVLLCSFHHHEVHRRDLVIVRLDAGAGQQHARAGHPPARTPAGTVARARWELRDRTGRRIGSSSSPRSGREPPDGPEPTWTTDPVTGMRVPTWMSDLWNSSAEENEAHG